MAIANTVPQPSNRAWLATGVALELASAAVLIALAVGYRDPYHDKYLDSDPATTIAWIMWLGPQGLGWWFMGRLVGGFAWLLGRPALMAIPTVLFLIGGSPIEQDCGRAYYYQPDRLRACEDSAQNDRRIGYGAGVLVSLASATTLVLIETDRNRRRRRESVTVVHP